MAQPTTAQLKPEAAVVSAAFVALKTYCQGSSRAALLPIDEAVAAALNDKKARKGLERELVTALKGLGSAVAQEYVCSKLVLIGSKFCVPSLAMLLSVPEVATAARNALEVIPDPHAAKTLRKGLPKLQGPLKAGAINSLGVRRDADSVRTLSKLLNDPDVEVAGAAIAALGNIGSARAAEALREFLPKSVATLRHVVADACLACAVRLLAANNRVGAQRLYRMLSATAQPEHVQEAVARGLEQAYAKK